MSYRMLKDYSFVLKDKIIEKFKSVDNWPELYFDNEDKKKLKTLPNVKYVNDYSLQLTIKSNIVTIPSQYILYAICVKPLAREIFKFIETFDLYLKTEGVDSKTTSKNIIENIKLDYSTLEIDEYSKEIGPLIFSEDSLNLKAKKIANFNNNDYKLRGYDDYFGSIILTTMNIPNASSNILGDIIYSLCKESETYSYFEKKYSHKFEYIIEDGQLNTFCYQVFNYLYQYDSLNSISTLLKENSEQGLWSIKDQPNNLSLTSIFKLSTIPLSLEELSSGGRPRYHKVPILFIDNYYYYLSTEWTNIETGRLDLKSLKKLITIYYPQFEIVDINGQYIFKDIRSYTVASLTTEETNQLVNFNNILYGPPGTGKTYHTKCKAVSIIDGVDYTIDDFNQYNPIYEQKVNQGDIIFTTFHQGMSYEEFIEGIKPKVTTSGNVTYEIQDGIFKQAAKQALVKSLSKSNTEESLIKKDYSDLLTLYKETSKELLSDDKVVLIIDEINRGNVSAIFGELITLIEDSKRLGQTDQVSAKLTYSKTEFMVPNNLFIIGTMNTADRSVEALDTALRRRFTFEQMLPNENLLTKINQGEDSEIDLQLLLSTINKRIQKLINKDHQIGHAYLINVDTLDSLNSVFKTKIIPLLEEYFYGDYVKIGRILGPNFVITNNFEDIDFLSLDEDEYTYTDKKHFMIDPAKEDFSVEDFQSIYIN